MDKPVELLDTKQYTQAELLLHIQQLESANYHLQQQIDHDLIPQEVNLEGLRSQPTMGLILGAGIVSLSLLVGGGNALLGANPNGWILIAVGILLGLSSLVGHRLYRRNRLTSAGITVLGGMVVMANGLLLLPNAWDSFFPYISVLIVILSSLLIMPNVPFAIAMICIMSHVIMRLVTHGLHLPSLLGLWLMITLSSLAALVISVSGHSLLRSFNWAVQSQSKARRRGDELFDSQQALKKAHDGLQVANELLAESYRELQDAHVRQKALVTELKAISQSKDKFFSIVAHDLKGPFMPLLGLSELLPLILDVSPKKEVVEMCNTIHTSAKNVYQLLENLLSWSRLQMGRMEHIAQVINLTDLANLNVELLLENASQKGITLSHTLPPTILGFADENMVNTVIRNLTNNALKFTPKGGAVTISAQATAEGMLEIAITDTGVGISSEDKTKLFRLDAHHTTLGTAKEQGTGLGLLICQEMVEANGGKIWVESELGQGTAMKFTIPLPSETVTEERPHLSPVNP